MMLRCLLSALLLMQGCGITRLAMADSPADGEKPTLLIVHSDDCPPCRQLAAAWSSDAAFRGQLESMFKVRGLDWMNPSERARAQSLGANRLPAFILETSTGWMDPVFGFRATAAGKADLLRALRPPDPVIRRTPARQPAADTTPSPSVERQPLAVRPATQSTVDAEAREQIRQVAQSQQRLATDVTNLRTTVEKSVSAQQQHAEQLRAMQQDVSGIRSEITGTTEHLSQQLQQSRSETRTELRNVTDRLHSSITETITDRLRNISTEIPVATTPREEPVGNPFAGWLLKLGLTGAATYFGLPIAGAGLAAGLVSWIVTRRRGRRRAAGDRVTVLRDEVTRKTTDNHYVVKETDRVGEAYKESIRRTCAAYKNDKPGIVDVARQIEHVATELLRGQDVTARAAQAPRPGIWDDSTEGK